MRLLLHGAGVLAPDGQTLTLPKLCGAKLAVAFSTETTDTLHVGLVPEAAHAPPQPRNVEVPVAAAVSVTGDPLK